MACMHILELIMCGQYNKNELITIFGLFEWGRQSNYTTPSKPSNVPILKHYREANTHRTQNRFTLQKHTENLSRMIDTPVVFVVYMMHPFWKQRQTIEPNNRK